MSVASSRLHRLYRRQFWASGATQNAPPMAAIITSISDWEASIDVATSVSCFLASR